MFTETDLATFFVVAYLQQYYEFLIKLEEKLCEKLVEGARLSDVYESTVAIVKSEHPDLVDKLTKNFGFVMGIEFREPSLSIAPNCTATVKKGMVFNLNVGFSGLTNSQVGLLHYTTVQELGNEPFNFAGLRL